MKMRPDALGTDENEVISNPLPNSFNIKIVDKGMIHNFIELIKHASL
jgi:hypothetical protein